MSSALIFTVLIVYAAFNITSRVTSRSTLEIFTKGFYGYPVSISFYFVILILSFLNIIITVLGFAGAIVADPNVIVISIFTGVLTRQSNWFIDVSVKIQLFLSLLYMFETYVLFKIGKEITLIHIIERAGLVIVTNIMYQNPSTFMVFYICLNSSFYFIKAFNNLSEYVIGKLCKESTIAAWEFKANLIISIFMSIVFGGRMWFVLFYHLITFYSKQYDRVIHEKIENESEAVAV